MKLITANKLNRFFQNGIKPLIEKRIAKTQILTTIEQVEANTNEENLPSAVVIAELINNLGGVEFIFDDNGKIIGYKSPGGADTVFPFSGSGTLNMNYRFSMTMTNGATQVGSLNWGGTGTFATKIADGQIISHSMSGSGKAITTGGAVAASDCTVDNFKVTSITWDPD